MSTKHVSSSDGHQTETRTYENGTCTNIQHTDNESGENHEHNVGHGGALGLFGAFTGSKK